jgi:hypothetical protein
MGLKSFAILSCCGKTEQIGVFRELLVLRTNDKKLAALLGNMESTTLESSLSWGQIKFHRWQKASWVASAAERYECSRLNSVQERTMPEFRCKMLNERGGTLFWADIAADTPDGAIRQAAEVYHTSNLSSPSRRVHAFEVWSGTSRLFPPPLNA